MPLLWEIPEETKRLWDSMRESMRRPVESIDKATKWPFSDAVAGPGLLSAFDAMYPQDVREGFIGGILGLAPGYIASNFRSPGQIQGLRRLMAEEMRSRGPVGTVQRSAEDVAIDWIKTHPNQVPNIDYYRMDRTIPDPIDQILRGSWYHGMSGKARDKLYWDLINKGGTRNFGKEGEQGLQRAFESSFPISLHDSASISNKLGEPAGVSISMLPTKAQGFSADEYIHRVLPQYGGPPTQRVVNLMSPEGRTVLNDAYDVVYNRFLDKPFVTWNMPDATILSKTAGNIENLAAKGQLGYSTTKDVGDYLLNYLNTGTTGEFNQALSNQLQSQGYRGLLYNPQRWNEHEMLMLDPKYVLPLDYRPVGEYTASTNIPKYYGLKYPGSTPGTSKGLSQIEDLMSQNKSRLGDIYSERPWTQRLSNENKQRLLELIDPQYREIVGNQLYQP